MTDSTKGQARVSVNLDIANLPPEAPAYILREAAAFGRIIIARAFADYRRNDLGDLPIQLFQYGYQLIHCPSWPNGGGRLKSVVDSILAQDLRDQAEEDPTLEVFVLGSGDRDFMAVVHALRRHGRRVIIAATPDASNRSLVAGADGYIPLPMPDRPERHERAGRLERQQPPAYVPTEALPLTHNPPPSPPQVQAPVAPPVPATPTYLPPPVPAPPPPQPTLRGHAPHQFHAQPSISTASLGEHIIGLVLSHPQITPRQVLQALAPRNEPGSARRRQAVGDAIALLVQQGKLARRRENVRGRIAEVLALASEEPVPAPPAAPEPAPAVTSERPADHVPTPTAPPRTRTERSPRARSARPPATPETATQALVAPPSQNGAQAAASVPPSAPVDEAPAATLPPLPAPAAEQPTVLPVEEQPGIPLGEPTVAAAAPEPVASAAPAETDAPVEPAASASAPEGVGATGTADEAEPAAKPRRRTRRRSRATSASSGGESAAESGPATGLDTGVPEPTPAPTAGNGVEPATDTPASVGAGTV
ncbi:MAG: NYN domain-containing protein [Chloroflexi bacterium]|nr:NYN domain-containing protein [Chloroflexota bacterium]